MNILKRIWNVITSMKLMLILLVLFALAIAIATFIENDYGVTTSWSLIYRAKWFELLQIMLAISLIGGIINYNMVKSKKLAILVFHFAFLIILIGAAITRYYGYEGMMSIREGATTNRMLSTDSLMQVSVEKNGQKYYSEKQFFLSFLGNNKFEHSLDVDGKTLKITLDKFLNKAIKVLKESPNGKPTFELVISTPYGPETYYLEKGKSLELGYLTINFDVKEKKDSPYINIITKNDKRYFISNYDFSHMDMLSKQTTELKAYEPKEFTLKGLYFGGGFQMVTKSFAEQGIVKVVSKYSEQASYEEIKNDRTTLTALLVDANYDGKSQKATLMGMGKGYQGEKEQLYFDDMKVTLSWGSKEIVLPFSLKLNEFIIDKYPGSRSPSSYESKVTLIDKQANIVEDKRIYMNNTLIHKGYTFFQSSYDKDEKGTILSVNRDPGKIPTYIGYFLLMFGLVLNLLSPRSRFRKLTKIKYINSEKISSFILFVALLFMSNTELYAQENVEGYRTSPHAGQEYKLPKVYTMNQDEIKEYVIKIDKIHADKFGELLVQDNSGRIKPMSTLAIELINKVAGGSPLFGLTHNQMFAGMVTRPKYWQRIPFFKVKHNDIKKLLGLKAGDKKFSYVDAFSKDGQYKLYKVAEDVIRKKPSQRGTFDKEIIKIDERLNIGYMIFEGEFFKSFPLLSDKDNTWFTAKYALQNFPGSEKNNIRSVLLKNYQGINSGYNDNNWGKANEAIDEIKKFQKTRGYKVLPNSNILKAEQIYNELMIFEKLYPMYLFTGLILLMLVFTKLIKTNLNIKLFGKIAIAIFAVAFIAHTFNLGLRWYIAGHAPWSNSYEAMLYISWTIILAGMLFARQSEFSLATTGIFSGITLFVAHLSWLDPQITTLVPVLKSYWLTIHVSVITASYGFLGLSAMLGFISLILFILLRISKNEKSKCEIVTNIKEAARINEISIIVGLTMLIIGNFLGGIWANESWGRYWGWDPKEAWTLISVIVYTLVIHLRYIPKLNNAYVLSVATLLAYSSIIMTYFGVNYYLSGLHSYATGDPIPIPSWIYYTTTIIIVLILVSFRYKNYTDNYITQKAE